MAKPIDAKAGLQDSGELLKSRELLCGAKTRDFQTQATVSNDTDQEPYIRSAGLNVARSGEYAGKLTPRNGLPACCTDEFLCQEVRL
jgi:hypothetical protein